MTILELKQVARSEMKRDGILSKGTRITIVEKARAGEAFSVKGSTYDTIRIGAALRKSGEHRRMTSYTIEAGKTIRMEFNQTV